MRKPRSHLRAGFSTTTMAPLFFWTVVAKEAVSGTGGRGRAEAALTSALGHPVWTAAFCEARETGRTETIRLFRSTPTDLGLWQGQTTRASKAEARHRVEGRTLVLNDRPLILSSEIHGGHGTALSTRTGGFPRVVLCFPFGSQQTCSRRDRREMFIYMVVCMPVSQADHSSITPRTDSFPLQQT